MKTEEETILDNRPLIYKTIKDLHIKYRNEDEFQEYYDAGIDGLIKGVRSYDKSKGKISTWCIPCIRNEMLKLMTKKNYKKNRNEFGIDLSLYSIIPESNDLEIIDTIEDSRINIETELEKKFELEKLLAAINQLKNEKDKLVIKMYYGLDGYEPGTYESIGNYLNVTKNMIQFRLNRAKKTLKQYLEKNDRDISIKRETDKIKKEIFMIEQSQNNKKTNTLSNLNDILFTQLERLNDVNNDDITFEKEIRKSYATAQLAQQIVSNNNTCIKALKLVKEHNIENDDQLKFIGLK